MMIQNPFPEEEMEIQIDREELFKSVSRVQSIIERKSNMPILSTILLTAVSSKVSVSATDLELGFQQIVPADVVQEGSITISGRKLFEILKESKTPKFNIKEKKDNWVFLSDGVAKFNLACLPADEYPTITEPEDVSMVEADGGILSEMINKTIYSVTREDAGFKLSGIFMQKIESENNQILRMVATDGHRLSMVDKSIAGLESLEIDEGIMIPKKGMTELNKMASEGGVLKIGFKDKNCVVKREDIILLIRLLDTKFPDYRAVIPQKAEYIVDIERMLLLDAMRKMLILSNERYRAVKIVLEEDTMDLVSTNPDLGEAQEQIKINYRGNRLEAGFNPQYFLDILQPMTSETIHLGFIDSTKPCLLTGDEDVGFFIRWCCQV
jgi:DNA polymerase-3 subunit beta